jgi:hypothetical protein
MYLTIDDKSEYVKRLGKIRQDRIGGQSPPATTRVRQPAAAAEEPSTRAVDAALKAVDHQTAPGDEAQPWINSSSMPP